MASDVMSLFGMDPNVIQQNRVQQGVDNASRMSADFAVGAAGGQLAGAGINSAFGLQTPDMAQAAGVQEGLQGADLTTAAGLRAAAQKLMMNGDYAQAMELHARARQMEASDLTASNAAEDREFGVVKSIKVVAGSDSLGQPILADRMVRYTLDGKVLDMLTGEDLTSKVAKTGDTKTEGGVNLEWTDSGWKQVKTDAPAVVEPLLTDDQKTTIDRLEERLKITPQDSPQADQLQAAIDNVVKAGEEAAVAGEPKKKRQIQYHVNTIEESRALIARFTKSDGTVMQISSVGRAQQNLRNALKQIYNLTGKDYSPEDYPVETPEK
tara:strand:+ start:313 stop:1284 length:972 start_codon:yes stop_codon:yes gene_type:complete